MVTDKYIEVTFRVPVVEDSEFWKSRPSLAEIERELQTTLFYSPYADVYDLIDVDNVEILTIVTNVK